jgi:hypothetical protein
MPAKRPATISMKELSHTVNRAVARIQEKHRVEFSAGFQINPGVIIGRKLRTSVDLEQAQKIAAEITQEVTGSAKADAATAVGGKRFEPAVLARPDIIICGFFPYPVEELEAEF